MPDDVKKESFHLSREVTWGHIMSTAVLLAGLIGIYVDDQADKQKLSERISKVEVKQLERQQANDDKFNSIQKGVDDVNQKVDRLIDLQMNAGRSR